VTTGISYRKTTATDVNAIWRVRAASIRVLCKSHYGEEIAEAWASVRVDFADVNCGREFFVAEDGGTIVGFGFLGEQNESVEARLSNRSRNDVASPGWV
jgi:hypothetical protein